MDLTFKLVNMQGTIIYQQSLRSYEDVIDIGNGIPSGLYLGLLYSDKNLLDNEKIIISE